MIENDHKYPDRFSESDILKLKNVMIGESVFSGRS